MHLDHHTILNAITRSIILCDTDPEGAKEGLYALGDYFKHYFGATVRRQTPTSEQDLEQVEASLAELKRFLKGPPAA